MNAALDILYKGGPFMWPLLLFTLVALVVGLLLAREIGQGKTRLLPVWAGVVMMVPLMGLAGSWQGLGMAAEAVAHTSAETQNTLAMAGYSTAMVTILAGLTLVHLLVCVMLVPLALASRGPAPSPAQRLVGGALVAIGLIAAVLATQGYIRPSIGTGLLLVGCVALGVAVAVAAGPSRGPPSRPQEPGRVLLAALGVMPAVLGLLAGQLYGRMLVAEAEAFASIDSMLTLMTYGWEVSFHSRSFAAVALLASLGVCGPVGWSELSGGRPGVGRGVFGLCLVALLIIIAGTTMVDDMGVSMLRDAGATMDALSPR